MVIGRILGMAGKALAKKFLSKKLGKKGISTFEKRKSVLQGSPLSKWHRKPGSTMDPYRYKGTKDRPTILSKYYKKKKD